MLPARCGVNSARGAAAQAPTAANRQGVSGGKQCAVQLTHTYQEQRSWQASEHAHSRACTASTRDLIHITPAVPGAPHALPFSLVGTLVHRCDAAGTPRDAIHECDIVVVGILVRRARVRRLVRRCRALAGDAAVRVRAGARTGAVRGDSRPGRAGHCRCLRCAALRPGRVGAGHGAGRQSRHSAGQGADRAGGRARQCRRALGALGRHQPGRHRYRHGAAAARRA